MSNEPHGHDPKRRATLSTGGGIAIGAGAGAALFAATSNPVWIAVGVAVGAAIGTTLSRR